jgi:ATP-dependent DNA helicase RecQ
MPAVPTDDVPSLGPPGDADAGTHGGGRGFSDVAGSGDGDGDELGESLPDLDGLTPVRTLAQLRQGPGRIPTAAPASLPAPATRLRTSPVEALRRGWGYDSFRPLQREAVDAALGGRDCLIVLPTGGGKSLCYQIPAVCGPGLVLVVSPLIALMDDQVGAAREAGVRASALHTHVAEADRRRTREQLASGALDLLYVSPERLVIGDLLPMIGARLVLAAVDEAHCVSHWGHDFRPEYRQLASVLGQAPAAARMGLTATATPQVQDDICAQLGLRAPLRLVGHVDRPNLAYRVLGRSDAVRQILDVVGRHAGEGGIVYAQTRKEVERLSEKLVAAGVHCAAYHAGLPAATRAQVQGDFVNERLDVVVATIAFGMGIDRSNVRYVVHANTPKSIEHYQQEAGRSGRDGAPAECVLLHSAADLVGHRRMATMDGPLPPDRSAVLERQLREIGRFAVAPVCRHRLLTEHFGQGYPPPGVTEGAGGCAACDVCLGETQELPAADALVIAQKIISAAWRIGGRFGAGQTVDVLLGRKTEKSERAGHDRLAVFGILSQAGEGALRAWIDQLVVQGLLHLREDGLYTFLEHTDLGRALCKGEGTVRLGRSAVVGKERQKRRGATAAPAAAASSGDDALFERLRQLRRLLAARQGVPPYLVFNDLTLRAFASERPATATALLAVKGVGESKLARYGRAFLAVIAGSDPDQAMLETQAKA